MAKNREPEKPVESDSSSDESDSSDSDSEAENPIVKKSLSTSSPKKSQPLLSSKTQQPSGDEDTESDSDSDSDVPGTGVRPLATKPMSGSQKSAAAEDPRSRSKATGTVSSAKPITVKRPAEAKESEDKENKRLKKKKKPESELDRSANKSIVSPEDPKKLLFQRVWSEDDEIVILKGMIDYKTSKKLDPMTNLDSFHDFIKKNLHVDVTRVQLQAKLRRLKEKYLNNNSKEKEGKLRSFSKPHEQAAYELSKSVWGEDSVKVSANGKGGVGIPKANDSAVKANDSAVSDTPSKNVIEHTEQVKNVKVADFDMDTFVTRKLNLQSVEERILNIGAELFERDEEVEGGREWKKLKVEEIELHLKKLDNLRAQTKLVLDGLNQ